MHSRTRFEPDEHGNLRPVPPRTTVEPARRPLYFGPEWSSDWPLSDIVWDDPPEWESILGLPLVERLTAWGRFFNHHADPETGSLGGEANRRWFDLEAVALFEELRERIGDEYDLRWNMWF